MNRNGPVAVIGFGENAKLPSTRKSVVVVGAGIAGLAAAWSLLKRDASLSVTVLEASTRAGGVLDTIDDPPYLIERSADNFATLMPEALDLCNEIGYRNELIGPEQDGRQAFVLSRGRILPVPIGFSLVQPTRAWPIITTQTLSWFGKLRMLGEILVPARLDGSDESLEQFAIRRLGREAFDCLVEPIVGGIFTADPSKLSMQATLPQFVKMEREHGGLIRGYLAAKRTDASAAARRASGARYDQFLAPRHGMSHWIQHLVSSLPIGCIRYSSPVTAIERIHGEHPGFNRSAPAWKVTTHQESFACDGLILATPTRKSAELLSASHPSISDSLARIEYASSAVVVAAVNRSEIGNRVDGFGLIVPAVEKRDALAISFTSNKYPGRAPDDQLLMRVFLGGARDTTMIDREDGQLLEIAHREIREILDWRGKNCRWQGVVRWPNSMPQYHVGHASRISHLFDAVAALGTLRLCGAGYNGVGIPQMIRSGNKAAEEIVNALAVEWSGGGVE